jgi:hypothetical protein
MKASQTLRPAFVLPYVGIEVFGEIIYVCKRGTPDLSELVAAVNTMRKRDPSYFVYVVAPGPLASEKPKPLQRYETYVLGLEVSLASCMRKDLRPFGLAIHSARDYPQPSNLKEIPR